MPFQSQLSQNKVIYYNQGKSALQNQNELDYCVIPYMLNGHCYTMESIDFQWKTVVWLKAQQPI